MTPETEPPRFHDGSDPEQGMRCQRVWPQDGTKRSGKRHGPILWITKLADYHAKDGQVHLRALATVKVVSSKKPAGVEPVWNLRRAPGQSKKGEIDRRSLPRVKVRGDGDSSTMARGVVSSIRITNELRERLGERGEEISSIMRRDLIRLYDLLDETRGRLVFPPGTLGVLADAWTIAAPPPPHDMLRPQWFVPVLLDACQRIGPEADTLGSTIGAWTPLEAYAVQDVVERWSPEAVGADKLRRLGLKEQAADEPKAAARSGGRQ